MPRRSCPPSSGRVDAACIARRAPARNGVGGSPGEGPRSSEFAPTEWSRRSPGEGPRSNECADGMGGTPGKGPRSNEWRRRPDLNRGWRFCRLTPALIETSRHIRLFDFAEEFGRSSACGIMRDVRAVREHRDSGVTVQHDDDVIRRVRYAESEARRARANRSSLEAAKRRNLDYLPWQQGLLAALQIYTEAMERIQLSADARPRARRHRAAISAQLRRRGLAQRLKQLPRGRPRAASTRLLQMCVSAHGDPLGTDISYREIARFIVTASAVYLPRPLRSSLIGGGTVLQQVFRLSQRIRQVAARNRRT